MSEFKNPHDKLISNDITTSCTKLFFLINKAGIKRGGGFMRRSTIK